MAHNYARLRERNQVTLPASVVEKMGLHLNDMVEFATTAEGRVELRPAKIVTAGTREASQEEQEGREDIQQGRYSVIRNDKDLRQHIAKLRKGEIPVQESESASPALTESQRKDVEYLVQKTLRSLLHNLVETEPETRRNEERAVERE